MQTLLCFILRFLFRKYTDVVIKEEFFFKCKVPKKSALDSVSGGFVFASLFFITFIFTFYNGKKVYYHFNKNSPLFLAFAGLTQEC